MLATALVCAVTLSEAPVAQVSTATETVVMLTVAEGDEARRQEQRLFDELGLVLDSFGLVARAPADPKFASASLPRQLEQVFAMVSEEDAVAVVWLSHETNGRLLLELVAQKTGRTLVRSIEGGSRSATERNLALAVRELLATAFLFEPAQKHPPAVSALVTELKQEVLGPPAPAPAPPAVVPAEAPWAVRADLGAAIGLVGDVGPLVQWLGSLQASRRVGSVLRLGLMCEVAGSRGALFSGASLTWWRIFPAATVALRKETDRLALGVGVLLGAAIFRWELLGAAARGGSTGGAFRGDLMLDGGVRLLGDVWFMVSPSVGWFSHQVVASNDQTLLQATAKVSMRLTAGLEARF